MRKGEIAASGLAILRAAFQSLEERAAMTQPIATISRLAFAATLALLAACSDKEPASPAAAESKPAPKEAPKAPANELAKFVPEGTAIYIEAPSVERLATAMRSVTAAFAPDKASMDIDAAIADLDLPGSVKEIDRTKPLAICVVLPAEPNGQPSPTYLVPVLSPDNFVRSVTESGMPFTTAIHGRYVAVSMPSGPQSGAPVPTSAPAPAASSEPAAIASELPVGDLVLRLDVQRLVAHYRPMIDMGLQQMSAVMESMPPEQTGGMNVAPLMKMYAEGITSVLDSGKTLDLAMRLEGNILEIASVLVVREKSALDGFASSGKTDAKALARYVDPAAQVVMVIGMDQAAMMQRMRPLLDATFTVYPEPMRSSFQKMMVHADELAAEFGSAMCVNGGLAGDGLRYAVYLQPRNAEKLMEVYRKMMTSVPGFQMDEMQEGEVAGVKVQRSRLRIDPKAFVGETPVAGDEAQQAQMQAMMERMYGKDGLAFTFAKEGDVAAIVLGGDDAFLATSLARLSKPAAIPPGIARGIEQVGDLNPCFVMHYNLGALMQGVQDVMGSMPGAMPMPIPSMSGSFTVHGGVDGRIWRGAMSTDIAELGKSFRGVVSEGVAMATSTKAQADLRKILNALETFAVSNGGKYPESLAVLVAPDESGEAYLEGGAVPKDPWDREYLYEPPSAERATPRVFTLGRDGKPGGTGEDADLEDSGN